jgi:hypothetical protein
LRHRLRPPLARGTSVHEDWCASLPVAKSRLFDTYVKHLETLYRMMSVLLNEAIDFRNAGRITKANQAVFVVAELCPRLTHPVGELLQALEDHAKHYGTIPNAAPLDPENFRGAIGQNSARKSGLLGLILLSQRSQFLHKTQSLREMVLGLGEEFQEAAGELADGLSFYNAEQWQIVDADHFDLNTCLREAIVLLKSFLVVLPEDQIIPFQDDFGARLGNALAFSPLQRIHLRHRRMARLAGQ